MSKFTITVDVVENYEFSHQIAGHFGADVGRKEIRAVVRGRVVRYHVVTKRGELWTNDIQSAVEEFNKY